MQSIENLIFTIVLFLISKSADLKIAVNRGKEAESSDYAFK
jgi:hypothetical protein